MPGPVLVTRKILAKIPNKVFTLLAHTFQRGKTKINNPHVNSKENNGDLCKIEPNEVPLCTRKNG